MLVEFRVKNFLSFKEEVVFSMLTSGSKEHPENLIPFDEKKDEYLTKTALIYGPNASGKTNLLEALHFVFYNALTSKDRSTSETIEITPFLFDEKTQKQPSFFEIRFIQKNIMYIYGLELDSEKIHREYLYKTHENRFNSKTTKVFERTDNQETNLNTSVSKLKKKYLTESAHNRLYLSVAGFWQDPEIVEPYKWFEDSVKIFVPGTLIRDKDILNDYTKRRLLSENLNASKYMDKIINIFQKIDLCINGLSFYKADIKETDIPKNVPESKRKQFLDYLREESTFFISKHIINNKEYTLPFEFESIGTQKALDLIGILIDLIEKKGVLVIDELENSLHPELTKKLLKQVQKSGCNVQIIFTTHDTNLMDLEIFRRDQFWFTEKQPKKQYSELYSLADIQGVRANENIEKKYLVGRYGAFPYIKDFEKALCG